MKTLGEQIEQEGFGILPEIVNKTQVEILLADLTSAKLPRSRAGIRHLMSHPGVSRIANSADALGIAKKVLGIGAIPFRATLFDKSPVSNWLVMWHQDTALPLSKRRDTDGWGHGRSKTG